MGACKTVNAMIVGDFNLHRAWANQTGRSNFEDMFMEYVGDRSLEQYNQVADSLAMRSEAGLISDLVARDLLMSGIRI